MKTVRQYLEEKLITFGGKAYPKFGNVVIAAGGAGSGKGFVLSNLVGIEGKKFDVDELKTLASRTPVIRKKIMDEMGIDLNDLSADLKNPDNVFKLHSIIGEYLNLPDKQRSALYTSVLTSAPDRKPNLIFDVTLSTLRKLENITRQVSELGYDKQNIHIVWTVNDIEIAKKQNAKRARTVPVEILVDTHRGASQTMFSIVNMGKDLKKYMDGDIVFAFNKIGVDSDLEKSDLGGKWVKDSNYVYIKKSGKPVSDINSINNDIRQKIAKYVPKNISWD